MQAADVKVGAGGQVELAQCLAVAAALLNHPLLPVQEQLIVLEHGVIADVLQPARPQGQKPRRPGGAELKGKAGEQATFAPVRRRGVHHREKAREGRGREVVPHQARGREGGVLAAELSPPRSLLPQPREAAGAEGGELQLHRAGVVAATDCGVVGEGHVAHIEHVLQQREGIHRQVAEGVLHQPAIGPAIRPFLQQRHQR